VLLQRFKLLWLGFWSGVLGGAESKNHSMAAQGAVEQQKRNMRNVREALTNLIFQRKRLADQLQALDHELVELRTDIKDAAHQDRDELALHLMARLETAEGEYRFLSDQITQLEKDIATARETETLLAREIVQAEQLIATLKSRHQALSVRRQLQSELSSLTRSVNATSASQPLQDQVRRLEAELETLQVKRETWEKDWEVLRSRRAKGRHEQALRNLKNSLQRRTIPAIVVAEPVR
jgi:phage shock protein A